MNVWILHHYADPPNEQWTGTYELGRQLVKRGHDVTVFSSRFNHYTRKDILGSSRQSYVIEYFDGVRFVFIKTRPYQRNDWRRILNMLDYSMTSIWTGLCLADKPDAIVGSTPHPFAPLAAYVLSRVKKARFLLELHDLWPQFLIEVGALSKRHPIVPVFKWIERFCFRQAKGIITLWPGMRSYIEEQGIYSAKAVWVPMGVDVSWYGAQSPKNHNEGKDALVFMYRGGFGWANETKVILDAAKVLESQGYRGVKIVLAGDGTGKEEAVHYFQNLGIHNVEFQDFVPKDQLPVALAEADVFLCPLPGVPQFQKYGQIATKLLDYLSAGRPTILAADIPNNIVERAQAGVVVPPGDPAALAQAIVQLTNMNPNDRIQMGKNGMQFVRQHHDIAMLAERFERVLLNSCQ